MTASPPNFDFAALSDHPPSAAGYAEFFWFFFFFFSLMMWHQLAPLPKPWNAIQYELAELRVRTYSEYRLYCVLEIGDCQQSRQVNLKASLGEPHGVLLAVDSTSCSQLQPLERLLFSSKPRLWDTARQWRPLLAKALPVTHRGLILPRKARQPADGPSPFTLMLLSGGKASKHGSVWHNEVIYLLGSFVSLQSSPVPATFSTPPVPRLWRGNS